MDMDSRSPLIHCDIENNESQEHNNLEIRQDESNEILGKVFDNPHEAYTFYNRYALLHGFGVRIHWAHKNRDTNETYRKIYVCNKQGFKIVKNNSLCGNEKKRRRDSRTGCEAMLRIAKQKDGKWYVDEFNDTHNHLLSDTITKVMKHRSHRKFHGSMACESLMSELSQPGLKPSQIERAVNVMETPHESEVTAKHCADILSLEPAEYKCYGIIEYFHDKALADRDHFLAVDLFDDGSPRNLFWADGRSRASYVTFADVVIFDITYMNEFQMSFASFIGVNHHGHFILFGAALLDNVEEETFMWLFENFLRCMFGRCPSAIITDQDEAARNVIRKVFSNSKHRYSAWHIKKHELEHLQSLRDRYTDFQASYTQWVKSDTIEEFESQWESLLGKYDIDNDSWLVNLYNQRKHWAKAFLKDFFFAGITTSKRSKSIHSYFDGFINSKTMLNGFLVQYDKAVDSRRAAEEDEDFKTMNTKAVLSSTHPIEPRAGECYTRKMFEVFKKEWMDAIGNVTHETLFKRSDLTRYRVGLINVDKEHWRIVEFHISECFTATCSCAKFETNGILCKHILYVIKRKQVTTLPDHFILPRWTMNARYKRDNASIELQANDGGNEVSALLIWRVRVNFRKALEEAKDSYVEMRKLNNFLLTFIEEQKVRKKAKGVEISSNSQHSGGEVSQVDRTPQICIRDPNELTITKGRPKIATRMDSVLEVNMDAGEKKKRICSYCKGLGHYITGCRKKKVDDNGSESHSHM